MLCGVFFQRHYRDDFRVLSINSAECENCDVDDKVRMLFYMPVTW